jgi:hypothetical protein
VTWNEYFAGKTPGPAFAPLPRFCDQSACDAPAEANTELLVNPTPPAFRALTKCVQFHCCQYLGSCITAAAWASVDGCEKMTCRWLQSVGSPCCLGLAARPVIIHPTATSVKSPAQYPSDRAPIPLIIVLTPWLALSWLARPKVLRAALQRFPVDVFVLVARVSQRPSRKPYRCACQRSSVKPVEIGRRSPPVGWFGPKFYSFLTPASKPVLRCSPP